MKSVDMRVRMQGAPRRLRLSWLFWMAIFSFIFARIFVFHLYSIPSGSMKSTLLVGDYLVVSKVSYGVSNNNIPFAPNLLSSRLWAAEPQRGDVVVFRPPHAPKTDFIKRVIGLPGDRIQMKDGVLHINGQPVERRALDTFETVDCDGERVSCRPARFQRFVETLPGGHTHHTLYEFNGGRGDRTVEFTVKPGHYFMLGDNRNVSEDSRFWQCEESDGRRGPCPLVPFESLVGRATVIWFSGDEQWRLSKPWTWSTHTRWQRLFEQIR